MDCIKKVFSNFYLKTFFIGWGLCCTVWSFMIFQFWWGNHDWKYLKNGIFVDSGFFEMRYSQHLPTVLMLDGQILPVGVFIISFAMLVVLAILAASYLEISKKIRNYLFFILVVTLIPHIAIVFYFKHYMFPLTFWPCMGVISLFLQERPYKWWKFLLGILILTMLLGSYPPILSLIFTLFMGRQILRYLKQGVLRDIIFSGALFFAQILIAFCFYKGIQICLEHYHFVSTSMYTLSVYSFSEILSHFPSELWATIFYFGNLYSDLGPGYAVFFALLEVCSFAVLFYKAKNKLVILLLILGLMLAFRLPFLLSASAYTAYFRANLWGELGLIWVTIAILFTTKSKMVNNFYFVLGVLFLSGFLLTDFEIQKIQYLGFNNQRLLQKRVEERFYLNPNFNLKANYATLHFGYPRLIHHFCYQDCKNFNNGVLDNIALPAEYISSLFWDEVRNPTRNYLGLWSGLLWFVNSSPHFSMAEVEKLRYWLYTKAKQYPHQDGIYIDDKFILLVLDKKFFDKYKERFIEGLLGKTK